MREELAFDLNEIPIEEEDESHKEIFDMPFIGQCFISEEETFLFYQKYAKMNGFSVRYGRFENNKKTGEKKRRYFFCHRKGTPEEKVVDNSKNQRNRGSSRCGCKAHMRIKLRRINEIFLKEWQVVQFVAEHNHVLLSTQEVRFLPSYRCITIEDENRILMLKEGGLSLRQLMRVIELERNLRHGELSFLVKDVHNFLNKYHRMNANNDARDLLEYCEQTKNENPNFQYTYTLDEESRLEHIYWSHAHSFNWYQRYGDVVVFYTTYKVNSYDMPFGIFVGIDNHGRTILLGCALLHNETTKAFRWLFENFCLLMGKPPQTILTDQDPWMSVAIAQEMPTTKHAYCIWHITAKFSGWFTSILRSEYSSWCSEFYSLYKLDTVEEFEKQWSLVIAKYNLNENKHVVGLYEIKEFWVPAYLRGFFFGDMTTTGRSESINGFIKRFISSRTCLNQFVRQVDLAIEDVEQKQMHDTMLEKFRGSFLRSLSPLEEQGHHYLTPYAFKKFQDEFSKASQYSVREENCITFIANHHKATRHHTVFWDGNVASCSCKYFEFIGILCRHILSVFVHKDCFEIPSTYWLSRWRRQDVILQDTSSSHQEATLIDSPSSNNSVPGPLAIDLVQCPPMSAPKGRPKKTRMKGGNEFTKQVRRCSLCKGVGHYIISCPENVNIIDRGIARRRARKRMKIAADNENLNPVFCVKY